MSFDRFLNALLWILVAFVAALFLTLLSYPDLRELVRAATSPEIIHATWLTLITSLVASLLAMTVAVPVGYALARREFPGKSFFDTLFDLPLVMPPIALGAALLIFFSTSGRGIDRALEIVFTRKAIVVAQFSVVFGFGVRMCKAGFESISARYERIARTLGLTPWQSFVHVALPLARPSLLAAFILTWARAAGEFGATVTLAGATKFRTETLPIAIFLKLATADVEGAIAAVMILVVLSIVLLVGVRKSFGGAVGA